MTWDTVQGFIVPRHADPVARLRPPHLRRLKVLAAACLQPHWDRLFLPDCYDVETVPCLDRALFVHPLEKGANEPSTAYTLRAANMIHDLFILDLD